MPLLYSCPGRMRLDNRQLYLVNTSMVRMPVTTMDILLPAQMVVGSHTPTVDENRSVTYKIPASLNRTKDSPNRKYASGFDEGRPKKAPDLVLKIVQLVVLNEYTYCEADPGFVLS